MIKKQIKIKQPRYISIQRLKKLKILKIKFMENGKEGFVLSDYHMPKVSISK